MEMRFLPLHIFALFSTLNRLAVAVKRFSISLDVECGDEKKFKKLTLCATVCVCVRTQCAFEERVEWMCREKKIGRSFNYSFIIVICTRKSIDCLSLFFFRHHQSMYFGHWCCLQWCAWVTHWNRRRHRSNITLIANFCFSSSFHFVGHRSPL